MIDPALLELLFKHWPMVVSIVFLWSLAGIAMVDELNQKIINRINIRALRVLIRIVSFVIWPVFIIITAVTMIVYVCREIFRDVKNIFFS